MGAKFHFYRDISFPVDGPDFFDAMGAACVEPVNVETTTKHPVVFGMPKSASTFVTLTLGKALDYQFSVMAEGFALNHFAAIMGYAEGRDISRGVMPFHHLYRPQLLKVLAEGRNTISHHHACANIQTLAIMRMTNNLMPIVTTRNVPDALLSQSEDMRRAGGRSQFEKRFGSGELFLPYMPASLFDKLADKDVERRLDLAIDLFCPWYFSFLASWLSFAADDIRPVHFIHYDDLIADETGILHRVAEAIEPGISRQRVQDAVDSFRGTQDTLYNVGVSGRGAAAMTPKQLERILEIGCLFLDEKTARTFVTGTET